MSEKTDSSANSSETGKPEQISAPSGKSKKKLWLMIVAVIVVVLLIGTAFVVMSGGKTPKHTLKVTITSPDSIEAKSVADLSVKILFDDTTELTQSSDGVDIMWTATPATAGEFDMVTKSAVSYTSGTTGATVSLKCNVSYMYDSKKSLSISSEDTNTLIINSPKFESVSVSPPSKTIAVGGSSNFTATAINSIGLPMTGVSFTWSVWNLTVGNYTLNTTSGAFVKLTVLKAGNATLNATATVSGVMKVGHSNISIPLTLPQRSVAYRFYDFFGTPWQQYWWQRYNVTGYEQPYSKTYPYIFAYHGSPMGNVEYYSDIRMNVTARNISTINMNEDPIFFPLFGVERGGNAVIDWYGRYLNADEVHERIPSTESSNDGWFFDLGGTITLDRQASKAFFGITDPQFDGFAAWWSVNNETIASLFYDNITKEGDGPVYDIYPAYEYNINWLDYTFWCEKKGTGASSSVVVHFDTVSWGIDALIMRWLRYTFERVEYYMEDMNLHMRIGPEYADVDLDGVQVYGLMAWQSTEIYAGSHPDPVWYWRAQMQDYVPSRIVEPGPNLYEKYMPWNYSVKYPGNLFFGGDFQYDFTPGALNLSANESVTVQWPSGPQLFICQSYDSAGDPIIGSSYNISQEMMVAYSQPGPSDFPDNIFIDQAAHTIKFVGPLNLYNWSRDQTTYPELRALWQKMGILPNGVPYIEFKNVSSLVQMDHFEVSGIASPIYTGVSSDVTVRAIGTDGLTYKSVTGAVSFTSSDPLAILPGDYTFTSGDQGTRTFPGGVKFVTPGTSQSVTVTTTALPAKTGSQTGIQVDAAPIAHHMVLSDLPTTILVNKTVSMKVTVMDQYGDTFTAYRGNVTFTSNRTDIVLPANHTFEAADAGQHMFDLNFTGVGWFTVTCADNVSASVNGTDSNIYVAPEPQHIESLAISAPTSLDVGAAGTLTVTGMDQYGHVFTGYNGTVHFSTNATVGEYSLPADYTFLAGDNGVKAFSVSFSTDGTFYINVTDVYNVTAYGNVSLQVMPSMPEIHYRLYDMFEEPFGQWWWGHSTTFKGRIVKYYQDILIWNETHKYVELYIPKPDTDPDRGVTFAPYHWSTDARNITWVTASNPYLMPERYVDPWGTPAPNATGKQVSIDLRAQYIDESWWFGWWTANYKKAPGSPTAFMWQRYLTNNQDGYLLGTVYNITMNREAALQWLNLSLSTSTLDIKAWWDSFGGDGGTNDYTFFWRAWVYDQGMTVYDVTSGYDDPYYDYLCYANLTVNMATDEVRLTIAHVNFGWEVLLDRWLTAANLVLHEPYWEDITLNATMTDQTSNIWFDAVGEWNLHAVRANASSTNEGAWAWEPTKIDYVTSWSKGAYHHSDFDPYANLTYRDWNSGDTDTNFGNEVGYDATPNYFNLTSYMTFTIEFPLGSDVPGYYGQGVPAGSIKAAFGTTGFDGDLTPYLALEYNGTASLGYYVSGGPDIASMYDPITKTITMVGPLDFNNPRGGGLLYHGAPWIEMNVTKQTSAMSASVLPQTPGTSVTGPTSSELLSIAAATCGVALALVALGAVRRH